MGRLADFLTGRQSVPLNEVVADTVPRQHLAVRSGRALASLPVAQRCMTYIADQIIAAEPRIIDGESRRVIAGRDQLPDWISQPSGEYTFAEFVQQAVFSACTLGGLWVLASVHGGGAPMFMYVGTSAIRETHNTDGRVVYKDMVTSAAGGEPQTITANMVAVRRRFSLPGSLQGASGWQTADSLLSTALHIQDSVEAFFANSMNTPLLFMFDDDAGGPDPSKELIAQLNKRHGGPRNAGRPIVANRRWKVEALRESNQANRLVEIMDRIDGQIASLLFGLDPMILNLQGSGTAGTNLTYVNASQLRSANWLKGCVPIANMIAECISDYLPGRQRFVFSPTEMLRGSPADRANLIQMMALAEKHKGEPMFSVAEYRSVLGYDDIMSA